MITIKKSEKTPPILLGSKSKGGKATEEIIAVFDSGMDVDFSRRIYAAKMVKKQLEVDQHQKCAFCERLLLEERWDVEHFRPKKGWQQSRDEPLQKPGYYWLAYEWSNLMLSCQTCNQNHKRNFFPLQIPEHRARSHNDDIKKEAPLLINPCTEDPRKSIGFRRHIAYPKDRKGRGEATIEILALNDRPRLMEERREHFEIVELFAKALQTQKLDLATKNAFEQFLADAVSPAARFSSMILDMRASIKA